MEVSTSTKEMVTAMVWEKKDIPTDLAVVSLITGEMEMALAFHVMT